MQRIFSPVKSEGRRGACILKPRVIIVIIAAQLHYTSTSQRRRQRFNILSFPAHRAVQLVVAWLGVGWSNGSHGRTTAVLAAMMKVRGGTVGEWQGVGKSLGASRRIIRVEVK